MWLALGEDKRLGRPLILIHILLRRPCNCNAYKMGEPSPSDARGLEKVTKALMIADDGRYSSQLISLIKTWIDSGNLSPVMEIQRPFVIKNIHVHASKPADKKKFGRQAVSTTKELKKGSIISSKRKAEV